LSAVPAGHPSKSPQNHGIRLALAAGMLSTYLTAFAAMAFAALTILTIRTTLDHMWHLGE
jgi:hypothetical protein